MTSNNCEILLYNQQLVVITYELIYIVKDAHHWGKNHCEIGLLWHRANHPALSSIDVMIFNEESFKLSDLTHKQLETHGFRLSTVATDALVPKHQAVSIHSAD